MSNEGCLNYMLDDSKLEMATLVLQPCNLQMMASCLLVLTTPPHHMIMTRNLYVKLREEGASKTLRAKLPLAWNQLRQHEFWEGLEM